MVSRESRDWKLTVNRSEINLPSNKLLDLGWRFTSETLIVQVSVTNQSDTWQVGGKLWATSRIKAKHTIFFEKNLDLFAQKLIIIPKIFPEKYSLHYRAPRHFTNVKLEIWEYIGEIPEEDYLTKSINFLVNQNLRIEESIKELINKVDTLIIPDNAPTQQQKQLIPFF